jgi:DNA-binding MarR family transcriptional regulator
MYLVGMDGVELLQLGRRLVKLAEDAIPANATLHRLPASVRAVMVDVFENPDSSIQEITQRTGYPQSHVSASVTKLRESRIFVTATDPKDRRRTLVRASPDVPARAQRFARPVDNAVTAVVGTENTAEVLAALDTLARHLIRRT